MQFLYSARAFKGAREVRAPGVAEGVDGGGALQDLAGEQRPAGPGPDFIDSGLAGGGDPGPDEAAEGIVDVGDRGLGIVDGRGAAQAVVDVPGEGLGHAVRARQGERVAVRIVGRHRRLEAAAVDGGVGVHAAGRIAGGLAEGERGVPVPGGIVAVGVGGRLGES